MWFKKKKRSFFFEKIDINKIEEKLILKYLKIKIFIEYSELGFNYLQKISKIIKKNSGDY